MILWKLEYADQIRSIPTQDGWFSADVMRKTWAVEHIKTSSFLCSSQLPLLFYIISWWSPVLHCRYHKFHNSRNYFSTSIWAASNQVKVDSKYTNKVKKTVFVAFKYAKKYSVTLILLFFRLWNVPPTCLVTPWIRTFEFALLQKFRTTIHQCSVRPAFLECNFSVTRLMFRQKATPFIKRVTTTNYLA